MGGKKKTLPKWFPFLLALMLMAILIAAAGYLYTRYIRLDGQFLSTDIQTLDLKDRGLSDVRELHR